MEVVSFRSLTTGLGVECGSWAVKNRSSTGCVIKSKKTKMDPRGKITLKKKVWSWQNNLLGIFAIKRKRERKRGQVQKNQMSDLKLRFCKAMRK